MRETLKKAEHADGYIKELFILQSNPNHYRIIVYTRDQYAGKVFKNFMEINQNIDISVPIKNEITNWEVEKEA